MDIFLIICKYFLLFMIYSMIGYVVEVTSVSLKDKKFNPNRGFLFGPWLPIYGVSSVIMVLLYGKKASLDNIFNIFLDCIVICTFAEYMTSLYMEKRFKVRWWDYSDRLLNINGRVCVENSLLFGIGGIAILYLVNPFVEPFVDNLSNLLKIILTVIFLILFVADSIVSTDAIHKIGKDLIKLSGAHDATPEIKEKVYKIVETHTNFLRKRIFKAYPKVRDIYKKRRDIIKDEIDKFHNRSLDVKIADFVKKNVKKATDEVIKYSNEIKDIVKEKINENNRNKK